MISLITDGMLYPITKTITAPMGGGGTIDPPPMPPCGTRGSNPETEPPQVPRAPEASKT